MILQVIKRKTFCGLQLFSASERPSHVSDCEGLERWKCLSPCYCGQRERRNIKHKMASTACSSSPDTPQIHFDGQMLVLLIMPSQKNAHSPVRAPLQQHRRYSFPVQTPDSSPCSITDTKQNAAAASTLCSINSTFQSASNSTEQQPKSQVKDPTFIHCFPLHLHNTWKLPHVGRMESLCQRSWMSLFQIHPENREMTSPRFPYSNGENDSVLLSKSVSEFINHWVIGEWRGSSLQVIYLHSRWGFQAFKQHFMCR